MTVWFTGDTHFGHGNILKHTGRPWKTVEEMDAELIERWNSRVKRGDHVWHLGDFAWTRKPEKVREYLLKLNGQVHLILGNHDQVRALDTVGFASIDVLRRIKVGEQGIVLCHYAMRVWQKSHYGTWHLYGHSHGNLADDPNSMSMDVGVDAHGFRPISFEEVEAAMKLKKFVPVDHHGRTDED